MESTFANKVIACMGDESTRHLLKPIPLKLLACQDYEPDWLYWLEYSGINNN